MGQMMLNVESPKMVGFQESGVNDVRHRGPIRPGTGWGEDENLASALFEPQMLPCCATFKGVYCHQWSTILTMVPDWSV